jgi:predicted nucleic acid-binding Zn ribbon protein
VSGEKAWKERSSFQELPKSVKEAFSKEEIIQSIAMRKILNQWDSLVGPVLADHSFPKELQSDSLIVQTSHSAYSQEIGFHSNQILQFVHKHLGMNGIKTIRCVIGKVPQKRKKNLVKKEGSLVGKDHLLKSIQDVEDPELKKKFMELIKVLE